MWFLLLTTGVAISLAVLYFVVKNNKVGLPRGYNRENIGEYPVYKSKRRITSNNFTSTKIGKLLEKGELDAIVIGSGISGLTTAGLLARCGKRVLVVEQHTIAGGCSHVYEEYGYEHETGVHYIGNIQKRSKILDLITKKKIQWDKMGREDTYEVYDEIYIGDKIYRFRAGEENYINDLVKEFPDEEETIRRFVNLVKETSNKDLYYNLKIVEPFWLQKILIKLFCRDFRKIAGKTCVEVMDELTDNEELKSVFCGQFGDYGDPRTTSFFMMASVVNHYLNGGYYPRGGPGEFPRQIIPVIERSGGAVLTGKYVDSIAVYDSKVRGVIVDGKLIPSKTVISSAGVINTYKNLLPVEYGRRFGIDKIIEKYGNSTAFTFVFIGLNGTVEELGLPSSNIWIWPDGNYGKMMDEYFANPEGAPIPMFIGFGAAKDSEYNNTHPNKSSAILLTISKYEWFERWKDLPHNRRGPEYEELKNKFKKRMMDKLFELYPHLKDKVDYSKVGTPLSTEYYIGSYKGGGYGIDCVPERFTDEVSYNLRPTTEIEGFFLTGQDITTLGFTGAMMAAVLTVHNVLNSLNKGWLKYGGIIDLLSGRNLIKDIMYLGE